MTERGLAAARGAGVGAVVTIEDSDGAGASAATARLTQRPTTFPPPRPHAGSSVKRKRVGAGIAPGGYREALADPAMRAWLAVAAGAKLPVTMAPLAGGAPAANAGGLRAALVELAGEDGVGRALSIETTLTQVIWMEAMDHAVS